MTYLNLGDFPGICEASTSIEEDLAQSLLVAQEGFTTPILVEWSTEKDLEIISLFTIEGKRIHLFEVSTMNSITIPTTGLSPGMYFLRFVDSKGKIAVRKVRVL